MTAQTICAMSEACAGRPADHGMMCEEHRTEDRLIYGRDGCDLCTDPEDGLPLYPMYGVAPHECYWRKGPQFSIGQSTLVPITPEHCFVPDLEDDEDWSHFVYPSACGIYYCPNCQRDRYQSAWDGLIARIGPPPPSLSAAIGEG